MGVLGSFVRFKVDFSAGSSSLTSGENGQFVESRTVSPTNPLGYYSQHLFEMKNYGGSFITRERGQFGIHWINLTSGEVDTSWITADYTAVEGAIETMWSAIAGRISSECRLVEHRWYPFGVGVVPPNPPSRVNTLTTPIAGTATGGWIRQVASTVTLRTTLRRHWGRIYLPIANSQWDTNGQLSSGVADALASAARTALLVSPNSQGVVPVVYDRNRKIAFGVTALEVDSVPDIQRRRRPRDTGYRKIYTS